MKKKTKPQEISFRQLLAQKLADFQIDTGRLSDGSGAWVNIQKGNLLIAISFDGAGNAIDDIAIFEDIVQVVDQKKILSFKK